MTTTPEAEGIEETHNTREVEEVHKWWLDKFVKGLPTIVTTSNTGEPELHPDFIEALHHQLQKAREKSYKKGVKDACELFDTDLSTKDNIAYIIDRYQAELDQDKV